MNKVTIILFCLLVIIKVQAQEIKTLTLKDAINYALENKAEVKKSILQVENSEYLIQEIRSRALPQISINGGLTYNPILQTNVIDGSAFGAPPGTIIEAAFGQNWSSIAGITLNQTLFDQSVFTGLKAAKSTREFYQINNQLTEEEIIEIVASNYYKVYVLKEQLKVLDSNYVNTSKVKNVIEGQFKNGLTRKIDLDRISVKLSNIGNLRKQVFNALQMQENALKFYMGMPIETKISLPQVVFEIHEQSLEEIPNTENRTEYMLLKKNEELLEFQKKNMEAAYYPTLSLSGNYNYLGQGPDMPIGKGKSDGIYWSDFSSIGLSLRIPVFTGFATRAKVRQADIDLLIIKEDLDDTKLALDLAYENAKNQINNNLNMIRDQKENVQLSQKVLSNIQNNYFQGLASLTELLDAENAYIVSQNNYTTTILDYKLAEIQLIKSQGKLKTLK